VRLPEVQEQLRGVAQLLLALEREISRRRPTRRARKRNLMTPALRKRILLYAAAHPRASYRQILDACNSRASSGRVSEILRGKRQ